PPSKVLPPPLHRPPGRPRKNRRLGEDELQSRTLTQKARQCSVCGSYNHTKKRCKGLSREEIVERNNASTSGRGKGRGRGRGRGRGTQGSEGGEGITQSNEGGRGRGPQGSEGGGRGRGPQGSEGGGRGRGSGESNASGRQGNEGGGHTSGSHVLLNKLIRKAMRGPQD
ncbi:hypothetical protein FRX31_011325, partial [Thalictrum thalictroides]